MRVAGENVSRSMLEAWGYQEISIDRKAGADALVLQCSHLKHYPTRGARL